MAHTQESQRSAGGGSDGGRATARGRRASAPVAPRGGRHAIRQARWANRGRRRLAVLAGLLGAALVLVGVLTYQAQAAARSHRGAAERALHDYASFAVWELSREATRELLAAMVSTFVQTQAKVDAEHPESWPTVASLQESIEQRPIPRPVFLSGVRFFFRVGLADSALSTTGTEPSSDEAAWVKRAVVDAPRAIDDTTNYRPLLWGSAERGTTRMLNVTFSNDSYVTVFRRVNGEPRMLVFALAREMPTGRPLVAYGFESDAASFVSPILGKIVQKSTLLPPSLVRDLPTDSILVVHAHDPAGNEVFHSGRSAREVSFAAADTLDQRFGNLVLELGLRPEVAGQLVVGGLPRSRLPLLIGLLALTTALVGVALMQLRRQEELSRLRTDFVSGVSHELRTPLAQIRLFAELLRKGQLASPAERVRSAEIIDEEAQRLVYLVENVLSFSRAEHGNQRVATDSLELYAEVRKAVEAFAPLARARRATLGGDVARGLVVVADPRALRQVLFNLFDNAVKYSPPGRAVTVGAAPVDEGAHAGRRGDGAGPVAVRLWVDDEGPGVPLGERERIWAPYYRMARDSETAVGGSGIGLAVVRELVELQGGRTWVEDAPSGGARFVVELPGADTDGDWPSPEELGAAMGVTAEHAAHAAAEAATSAATNAAVTAAANATANEG